MKKKLQLGALAVIILAGLLFLGGCAGSRTYLLHLSYDTAKTPLFTSGAPKPLTVAVYNFQDARPERLYLGRRVYRDGMVDLYKPDEGTVEQVVIKSITNLLEKAGFKVVRVNRYLDPHKENFKDIPADAGFGGKIDALWVEAKSGVVTTATEAKMRLQVSWGLPKERVWVNKTIEGTVQETNRPLYEPKHAEAKINEVFKEGLDKLLRDETVLREKLLKQ